jgi:hypothetical protein
MRDLRDEKPDVKGAKRIGLIRN